MKCSNEQINQSQIFENLVVIGIKLGIKELNLNELLTNDKHFRILQVYKQLKDKVLTKISKVPNGLKNLQIWCIQEGIDIYDMNLNQIEAAETKRDVTVSEDDNEDEQILSKRVAKLKNNNKGKNKNINSILQMCSIFHFVTTDEEYIQRYCTCLKFYEKQIVFSDTSENAQQQHQLQQKQGQSYSMPKFPINEKNDMPQLLKTNHFKLVYVPKAICIVSLLPLLDLQAQFLYFIFQKFIAPSLCGNIKQSNDNIIQLQQEHIDIYKTLMKNKSQKQTHDNNNEIDQISIEQAFLEKVDQINSKSINMTDTLIVKEQFLFEFYLSVGFSLVNRIFEQQASNSEVSFLNIKGTSKNPQVFTNLNILQKNQKEMLRFRTTMHQQQDKQSKNKNQNINAYGLQLVNFSFKPFFKKLQIQTIMKLVKYILLEQQIVIFAADPDDITLCLQCIFYLIAPLQWMNIYIPYLPSCLYRCLDAFMPYIIGMHKRHMTFISTHVNLTEKVVLLLDDNTFLITPSSMLNNECNIPLDLKIFLMSQINKDIMEHKNYRQLHISRRKLCWAKLILRTKSVFSIFIVCLINNYIPFFLPTSSTSQVVLKIENQIDQQDVKFSINDYLLLFSSQHKDFMLKFTETNMFLKLIEDTCANISLYTCAEGRQILRVHESFYPNFIALIKIGIQQEKCSFNDKIFLTGDQQRISYSDHANNKGIQAMFEFQKENTDDSLLQFMTAVKIDLNLHLIHYVQTIQLRNPSFFAKLMQCQQQAQSAQQEKQLCYAFNNCCSSLNFFFQRLKQPNSLHFLNWKQQLHLAKQYNLSKRCIAEIDLDLLVNLDLNCTQKQESSSIVKQHQSKMRVKRSLSQTQQRKQYQSFHEIIYHSLADATILHS